MISGPFYLNDPRKGLVAYTGESFKSWLACYSKQITTQSETGLKGGDSVNAVTSYLS